MADYERLTATEKNIESVTHVQVGERDDLSGLALNMFGKLDGRSIIIIWLVFLFIHTELFAENILKKFSGSRNEDGTMTMKGTLYASCFMMMIVIICTLVF